MAKTMKFIVQKGEGEIELKAPFLYAARVEAGLMDEDKRGEVVLRLDDGKVLKGEELEQFCRENQIYYF